MRVNELLEKKGIFPIWADCINIYFNDAQTQI